ncbi:MAG: response regulator transcription factor [Meiothermus sp.]|nr:response regulator transcription factor [Meiothermus sp.]
MLKVLVIDDESVVRKLLRTVLERGGYQVLEAVNGLQALDLLPKADLVVLDWNMPEMDGIELLEHIRQTQCDLPTLMLTAHDRESERVRGLRSGADDYMGKPLRNEEFLARVEALLRRSRRVQTLRVGPLELDPASQDARLDGMPLELTPTEFRLLLALARYPGQTLPRKALFSQVWGDDPEVDERIVDYYVKRLRKKLGDHPKHPRYLETSFGRGYRIKHEPVAVPA